MRQVMLLIYTSYGRLTIGALNSGRVLEHADLLVGFLFGFRCSLQQLLGSLVVAEPIFNPG